LEKSNAKKFEKTIKDDNLQLLVTYKMFHLASTTLLRTSMCKFGIRDSCQYSEEKMYFPKQRPSRTISFDLAVK
jgi:hypothetical protein